MRGSIVKTIERLTNHIVADEVNKQQTSVASPAAYSQMQMQMQMQQMSYDMQRQMQDMQRLLKWQKRGKRSMIRKEKSRGRRGELLEQALLMLVMFPASVVVVGSSSSSS
jgi:hypothetical protein